MTSAQVRDELGVSRATLYRMVADKRLIPIEWNAALKRQPPLRFRRSQVEALKRGDRPGPAESQP